MLVPIKINNKAQKLDSEQRWLEHLFLQGYFLNKALCSGLGRCGECKIRFKGRVPAPTLKDKQCLKEKELAYGLRLACEHFPEEGEEVFVAPNLYDFASQKIKLDTLAIDVGTTNVKWGGVKQNKFYFLGKKINPQMGAGSEVVARLAFALRGNVFRGYLQRIIREDLEKIISGVESNNIGLAGNSVMIYLIEGEDVRCLSRHPFFLTFKGDTWLKIANQDVYIPPLLSPFLGADISADFAYVQKNIEPEYPYLFFDLGTNGEILLVINENKILGTSVALGPALEGIGLRFGGIFSENSVSDFYLTSHGIGWTGPKNNFKITGTGYLKLIDLLLRINILDRRGQFTSQGVFYILNNKIQNNRFYLTEDVFLDLKDVEEILKVKAAINTGINFLFKKAKLNIKDVSQVFVTGFLGLNITQNTLINIGFFPFEWEEKILFLENSVLQGVTLLAGDEVLRKNIVRYLKQVQTFNLSFQSDFIQYFVQAMNFDFWRNKETF
ncbi:MAG: ASKHA domain-containing protein [Desulfonauticus sp.]|nr:ASKHA domain-containing protein [Desulfonauticus sp.]